MESTDGGHGKPDANGETPQTKTGDSCGEITEQPPKSPYSSPLEAPKSPNASAICAEETTKATDGNDVAGEPVGDQTQSPVRKFVSTPDIVAEPPKENVTFIVIHSKTKYDVEFPLNDTIDQLKLHLQTLTGVPQQLQKVMYKGGLAKDDKSLKEVGVVAGAKLMLVGSKLDDVISVISTVTNQQAQSDDSASSSGKVPLGKLKNHRKVLERGPPDDAMPGILNSKESLPPFPLSGMLNKSGGKVRLTFKLELDQLWIGTKDRTDKVPMASIKGIVSEPIDGHEQYHIMGFQMGTTEASRYWVYWVPAQYIDSIKEAVLGPWES